jgi:RNA polymerase sigma-70 factor (ECF subfamily)
MDEDKQLVKRTLKGEKDAFEMILRKYQMPLFNYVGRMVGEREMALDFTQDIFIKAYTFLPTYREEFKFSTWLFKIASNYMIDHWRRKKVQTFSYDQPLDNGDESLAMQLPCDEPSAVRRLEMAELRDLIEEALKKLPGQLRELFVWRHVNGLSYEEMAEIKGLPVGTVKNRVFQAKEILRRLLEAKP